ncbi:unnamed protein product [Oppiella nova]|uniref:Endoglucanase n=1 Tax=Oppiella nova TaxID=334625 RepID=A0A7R9LFY8_9ACAR|nr:unnamed protein product [Oppiella nova]CAG2163280.1 unnamed protein product [Oppiella nova]
MSGETGNWIIELIFDAKVIINSTYGGEVKTSSPDELTFTLGGDPLKAGENHTIQYQAHFDHNAGANLISAKFNDKPIDIGPVATVWPITVSPVGPKGNYNYGAVIHASLLFYEAQRSGKLPADKRVHWRGDSMLDDGKDVGKDLTGGYFDAGDLVKFGFPMAFTMTVLSWSLVDYEDAYKKAGELENVRNAIKWGTDYFLKCHTSDTEFYGQVGNGNEDHAVWGRPEDWPKTKKVRPAYKVTSAHGGSELTGETSAALTAASLAFAKSDPTYSATLLTHAKSLYAFADKYRANYTIEIPDVKSFYNSISGYGDELAWAATWLLRATNDSHYKAEVDKHFKEFTKQLDHSGGFGWDDKSAGAHVLLAQIVGDKKYKDYVQGYCDWAVNQAPKTPKGLAFMGEWGSLRSISNVVFICLQAAKLGINEKVYQKFGETQIGYILGDTGRSFVVGVGVDPPSHPHHRPSSCPNPPVVCDSYAFNNPGPNPHTLTGALVGGPDVKDGYNDTRDDYVHNEVACDYNAGFQASLVALLHLKSNE